jgi:hypothetical protein
MASTERWHLPTCGSADDGAQEYHFYESGYFHGNLTTRIVSISSLVSVGIVMIIIN